MAEALLVSLCDRCVDPMVTKAFVCNKSNFNIKNKSALNYTDLAQKKHTYLHDTRTFFFLMARICYRMAMRYHCHSVNLRQMLYNASRLFYAILYYIQNFKRF